MKQTKPSGSGCYKAPVSCREGGNEQPVVGTGTARSNAEILLEWHDASGGLEIVAEDATCTVVEASLGHICSCALSHVICITA
jgi:hypothetical protein